MRDLAFYKETTLPILRQVFKNFSSDQCMRIAASLSYTTLLSLVPLLSISFAIFAAFPAFDGVQAQVQSYVFENFVPSAGSTVADYLATFTSKTGNMTTIGIVGLSVTALMLLATIEDALNRIFKVKAKRPLVSRFLMFWALLTLGPLLIGASLSLSTYFYALNAWVPVDQLSGAAHVSGFLRLIVPNIMIIAALTLFYLFVPNRSIAFKNALFGGIMAGVSFAILKKLFGLYISHFPSYQAIYGVLATIPIFLIWMYLTWAVVLMGATLAATLQDWGQVHFSSPQLRRPIDKLAAALSILTILQQRFDTKGGVTPYNSLEKTIAPTVLNPLLQDLEKIGLILRDHQNHFGLAQDLSQTPLFILYQGLGLSLTDLNSPQFSDLVRQEEANLAVSIAHFLKQENSNLPQD